MSLGSYALQQHAAQARKLIDPARNARLVRNARLRHTAQSLQNILCNFGCIPARIGSQEQLALLELQHGLENVAYVRACVDRMWLQLHHVVQEAA